MNAVQAVFAPLVEGLRPVADDNWTGFCPLHHEVMGKSRPSFSVNMATGQWHCFTGCGGGSLPSLLRRLGKTDDYIKRTIDRVKPYLVAAQKKREREAKALARMGGAFRTDYPLPEKLLGLFEYVPTALLDAGFTEDVLLDNDVGYDPHLDRITFGIRDVEGTLAGIAGRVLGGGDAKYMVYQQDMRDLGYRDYHFHKSDYIWRCDKLYRDLYDAAPNEHTLCIVEGYKAGLWLVQNGFDYTGALMGTSLSDKQLMFIQRLGARVVLCLDNDGPGRVGTSKAAAKLRGVRVSVMRYPDGADGAQPDDLDGRCVEEGILNPMSLLEWRRKHHVSHESPQPR